MGKHTKKFSEFVKERGDTPMCGIMKKKLTIAETVTVGSMLFGLFFGAGNLIFPVFMGQSAGENVLLAIIGFLITGVGIPLLGVASLGMSRSNGVYEMSGFVGKKYAVFFTVALYLTIGPFFAIPRCASTSFSVGIKPMIADDNLTVAATWIFSALFFAAVLIFSLYPGKILTWVGRILTPLFLVSLGILLIYALVSPMGDYSAVEPQQAYQSGALFKGFIEGYNTMDVLAGLAFGIVVVNAIKGVGVKDPSAIASSTVKSGIVGCAIMALIYAALAIVGAQSRTVYGLASDGGEALSMIARHYFGDVGAALLAVIVTLACLKTAAGLITSCSEAFCEIFPNGPKYKFYAVTFCVVSFLISTIGLSAIISWSLPVLMFLYPLSITLILLALCGKLFDNDKVIYRSVTAFTLVASFFDFVKALPADIADLPVIKQINAVGDMLPFADLGLGWVCPAILGLIVGIIIRFALKKGRKTA